LRSNIDDWSDRQLWKAYIQLTQAEAYSATIWVGSARQSGWRVSVAAR